MSARCGIGFTLSGMYSGFLGKYTWNMLSRLLSSHWRPVSRFCLVVINSMRPGVCVGSICVHQSVLIRISLIDSFAPGAQLLTGIVNSRVVLLNPMTGIVAKVERYALFWRIRCL